MLCPLQSPVVQALVVVCPWQSRVVSFQAFGTFTHATPTPQETPTREGLVSSGVVS